MRATPFVLILLASIFTPEVHTLVAQRGVYGPVSVHVKAGDPVPDLIYSKILSGAGGITTWSSADFTGKFTVLAFFPDTSHNPQQVSRWNATIEQFADKAVQFGWVTGEKADTLLPWLKEHPIKSWVFYDPDGATGRAFGMERPASVIVGPDRNIIGFAPIGAVDARAITAALEGRITTVRLDPSSIREFAASGKVRMDAEPVRFHGPDEYRPNFPPSYTVHISPSTDLGEGTFSSGDFISLRGYSLKRLVAEVYGVTPPRVAFPPAVNIDKRYDVALVLPEREDRQQMNNRIQQAIQDYFHSSATHEERLLDVYVVTALDGKPPAVVDDHGFQAGGISFSRATWAGNSQDANPPAAERGPAPMALAQIRSISTEGTIDAFCSFLERTLDRPVLNETHVQGRYKFSVKASDGPANDFIDRVRDQLHLVIAPEQRRIDVLVLNPR